MCDTFTRFRSVGCLLLFLLGCLQLTFAEVSPAIPGTYIRSSVDGQDSSGRIGGSEKSPNRCGNLETECRADQTTENQFSHQNPFTNHLLGQSSGYELQRLPDSALASEKKDRAGHQKTAPGYRGEGSGNQFNRPAMNRPIWNVPFRVMYGSSGRNLLKFGKRSLTNDGFDAYTEGRFKFGKRPRGDDRRMFKFGKRTDRFADEQDLSQEDEKRMFKFGKRTDDFPDDANLESEEEKRMFKFGRRADGWSGESKIPVEDEKRMFKFGKRRDDLDSVNEVEKRKFSFGKRTFDNIHSVPGGEETRVMALEKFTKPSTEGKNVEKSEKERRMIKFGKKSKEFDDENLSKLEAETGEEAHAAAEEGKRMFKFGKKSDPTDESTALSEDKRKFMFGKRDETTWNTEQQVFDEGLNSVETDTEELPLEKRKPKFQFGRRLAPRPEEQTEKVRSRFKLGKRWAAE